MKFAHLIGTLLTVLSLSLGSAFADTPMTPSQSSVEEIFNFGHVGIDYVIHHDFAIFNPGPKPIRIDSTRMSCDCSNALVLDSVIVPGDTGYVRLQYSTRDDYGVVSKSMKVFSNDRKKPVREFFYVATVGRWLAGLKPEPPSLFFLPGANEKKITMLNDQFDSYELVMENGPDSTARVQLIKPKPRKGATAEISVTPLNGLQAGTYLTSFRLKATVPGINEPVYLTIPVKIVRY